MYPLQKGMMYAKNCWYVAAMSHEVGRNLLARRFLDVPVVMYRTEAGRPVAFEDMCPHRRFPLSKSKLVGDAIQCSYHGFTFESGGRCTALPTGDRVPPNYAVKTFPVVERWNWIWIWMGDPALADPSKLPDHNLIRVESEGWEPAIVGLTTLKARYMLLHENLLDLSHLTFLHEASVGSAGIAKTRMEIEDHGAYIEVTRRIKNDTMEGVPLGKTLGIEGPVDRLMAQQFFAPSFHATGSAFTSSVEGGSNPGHYYGGFRVLHGITPESSTSTHYFYAISRDFRLGDQAVLDGMRRNVSQAVAEDVYASEEIETRIDDATADQTQDFHSRADAGSLRGRLMIEQVIEAEQLAMAAARTTGVAQAAHVR